MTQPPITPNYAAPQKSSSLAVTSLILGIAAFAISCIPYLNFLGWIAALVAIILGFVARRQVAAGTASGGGMAVAGIILGIVYLVLAIIAAILIFAFGVSFLHWAQRQQQQMQQQQQNNTSTSPAGMIQFWWSTLSCLCYTLLH